MTKRRVIELPDSVRRFLDDKYGCWSADGTEDALVERHPPEFTEAEPRGAHE
jgi:hypothetical protein